MKDRMLITGLLLLVFSACFVVANAMDQADNEEYIQGVYVK